MSGFAEADIVVTDMLVVEMLAPEMTRPKDRSLYDVPLLASG